MSPDSKYCKVVSAGETVSLKISDSWTGDIASRDENVVSMVIKPSQLCYVALETRSNSCVAIFVMMFGEYGHKEVKGQ